MDVTETNSRKLYFFKINNNSNNNHDNHHHNNYNRLWQTRVDVAPMYWSYQIPEPPVMKVTFINRRGKVSSPITKLGLVWRVYGVG